MTSRELGLAEPENLVAPLAPASNRMSSHLPSDLSAIPSSERAPSFFVTPKNNLDSLFTEQNLVSPEQQLSTWLTLGSSHLAALFDAGWTLEAILDALKVTLQGVQGMAAPVRNTLLQMTGSALVQAMPQPISEHPSQEERHQLVAALGKSIDEGWHLFHKTSPAQVLVIAQTLLTFIQQAHSFLSPDVRPSLYASTYNLLGASLLFQGHYESARRAHERAQIAALEAADVWTMAQSLNWQAIASQICGRFQDALFSIEAALRLLGQREDIPSVRLRAHLLADWAYNAAHLPERTRLQEQLEASAELVRPLELDEEFDILQWQQIAGTCFLLRGKYSEAIQLLEQTVTQLPETWLVRHLLTLFPLAEAYARAGERDRSLETGTRITTYLGTVDARMFYLRFGEYYQTLCSTFPHDQRIHAFFAQTRQLMLSPLSLSEKEVGR
jgi:tetratricopeptide (TPR) repeat protein